MVVVDAAPADPRAEAAGQPADAMGMFVRAQHHASAAMDYTVRQCRRDRVTWREIAAATGLSKENAAQRRWGPIMDNDATVPKRRRGPALGD